MAFTLKVEFAGLCAYLEHSDGDRVAILMPDCRRGKADPVHVDGTMGVPHVGYVRFDLANLVEGVPAGDGQTGPLFEVVHRLSGEVIDFGPGAPGSMRVDLAVPDIAEIGPTLDLVPDLFTSGPPALLLARTILRGGELVADGGNNPWSFSRLLSRSTQSHGGHFAGFATWQCPIAEDELTVGIRKFDGSGEVLFTLRPDADGVVSIKVANLCSNNPLEWDELDTHMVTDQDLDFKWLYRLFEPRSEPYPDLLLGATLPVPQLRPGTGAVVSGDEDCLGGKLKLAFNDGG